MLARGRGAARRRRVATQVQRDRALRHRPAGRAGALRPVARRSRGDWRSPTICSRPTSTGSARSRLRQGPQGDRGRSATTRCCIRCSTWPPGSTRTSTSPIASARSSCPRRSRRGPGRPDLAVKLLLKGLGAQPTKWEYMQDIGFVHFWAMQDYKGAAEWFERGSQVPGAAWFLKPLAATTLAQGGHRSASRTLFQRARRVGRERLDPQGRGAPAAPARRDGRHRRAAPDRRGATASAAARRRSRGKALVRARLSAGHPDRSGRLRLRARPVERGRLARRGIDARAAAEGAAASCRPPGGAAS